MSVCRNTQILAIMKATDSKFGMNRYWTSLFKMLGAFHRRRKSINFLSIEPCLSAETHKSWLLWKLQTPNLTWMVILNVECLVHRRRKLIEYLYVAYKSSWQEIHIFFSDLEDYICVSSKFQSKRITEPTLVTKVLSSALPAHRHKCVRVREQ